MRASLQDQVAARKSERVQQGLSELQRVQELAANDADRLCTHHVKFSYARNGTRLVVSGMDSHGKPETIDYWPDGGYWVVRYDGKTGKGLQSLIERVKP